MILDYKGHRYSAVEWSEVEGRFHDLIKKNGGKTPFQAEIRAMDPALYHQLRLWGCKLGGTLSPRHALEKLVSDFRRNLSDGEVVSLFRDVLTHDFVSGFLSNPGLKASIKDLMLSAGPKHRQAYFACFNKNRSFNIEDLVNSIHPEYPGLYGLLHGSGLSEKVISGALTKWYYDGKDLSPGGIESFGVLGRRIKYHLQKKLKSESGKSKYWKHMVKYLDVPRISVSDIKADGQDARSNLSQIVELQACFLLEAARRFDPELATFSDGFRRLFGPKIVSVYHNSSQESVELSGKRIFADLRVVSGSGHVLVEAKTKNVVANTFHGVLDKYSSASYWRDGAPVSRRVLLLNSGHERAGSQVRVFSDNGWLVWAGDDFLRDYMHGLELIAENDPGFFASAPIPVADCSALGDIAKEIMYSPHVLMRRPHIERRQWIRNFLKKNIVGIKGGIRVNERKPYDWRHREPFGAFHEFYNGREELPIPGALFLDLETSNSSIAVLGMAYMSEGTMFTDLLFARNPWEERMLLETYLGVIKNFGRVVTFNGASFDLPFLQRRLNAYFLRQASFEHVDMYKIFAPIARKQHFPTATLQTYERTELGIVRKNDISGDRIPEVYSDFINGLDDGGLARIITHNHFDLITLASLYAQHGPKG